MKLPTYLVLLFVAFSSSPSSLLHAAAIIQPAAIGQGESRQFGATTTDRHTPPATVTFHFERDGLPVPRFTITLHQDGTGRYQAEETERRSADSAVQQVSTKQIDRPLTLSPETTAKVFQMAETLDRFHGFCGTKAKNIADTGRKTLSYAGPEGAGACTYNYSDDKNVTALTSIFYAVGYTMDVGRRLDFERRFDRLGLDAEMLSLERAVAEKNALELGTIAPTLRTIAADPELMQRVRTRAAKLLDQSSSSPQ